jgi:DNA invertase Pin-like site-specific DNA recombinase
MLEVQPTTEESNMVTEQIKSIVAYYRVSTRKQEETRLGLDAQVRDVDYLRQRLGVPVIDQYTEVETGSSVTRPKLQQAIAKCRATGATLVVAKLDRLARNVEFVANLMNSCTRFVCCDNPQANELTIHVLAAVAQAELKSIQARTKAGLESARLKGPGHWEGREHLRGWNEGLQNAAKVKSESIREHYAYLLPRIKLMRENGNTLAEIVAWLNKERHLTSAGKLFTAAALHRVIGRYLDASYLGRALAGSKAAIV